MTLCTFAADATAAAVCRAAAGLASVHGMLVALACPAKAALRFKVGASAHHSPLLQAHTGRWDSAAHPAPPAVPKAAPRRKGRWGQWSKE